MLVVLDELLGELSVEDVLCGDDEAGLGDLLLRPVDVVDFGEVLAGVEFLECLVLPHVVISRVLLVPSLRGATDT